LLAAVIPPTSLKASLKRRAVSPELSDSENVDPKSFELKRKRASADDDVSFAKGKPARYSLSSIPPSTGPRVIPSTPRLDTNLKGTTPMSAPPAAGRSPTRKRPGLQQTRRRFIPPTVGIKSPSLSIAAALNGTISHKKTRKVRTIEESKPKSWFFDIYEEPEAVQHDRMNDWTMSQSATNLLDISDDEGKVGKGHDDRGKENVDPNEPSIPLTRSMAAVNAAREELKKDIMADDRAPLVEMNPAKYYPEGLDATSVVLVHDDAIVETAVVAEQQGDEAAVVAREKTTFTFKAEQTLNIDTSDIAAVIKVSEPKWEASIVPDTTPGDQSIDANDFPQRDPGDDLEIWESESAKDENEKPTAEDGVFALSEL
jgi:hypothetical protein